MAKTKHQAANAALKHFLNGERFSRLNLPDDVGRPNDSLHSVVSTIQNQYFIPVFSELNSQGVCDYWMDSDEIDRYHNSRNEQREDMKHEVHLKSIVRDAKAVKRLAEKLAVNSDGLLLVVQELYGKGKFAELVIKAANDSFGQGGAA